jgi:Family of unknown function (DUF6174)
MNTMRITFLVIILILAAGSCKDNPTAPNYETQYELWRSYNIHDYAVEQSYVCFCVNGGEKMKVTVQADTVFSVMKISDSTIIPYPESKRYLTIDSLFGILHTSKFDSLVVNYNSHYGYPDYLDINPQLHPVDGGILYITSNLQIIYNNSKFNHKREY